ncbi:hypothetical protein DRQ53_06750 [bacterium]|nr:MAG: hypothetical protein DRQ32_08390 [bacterium]RKZ16294.1 MAG: hypothetical protein DRQ53_06750 [bacterium]
MGNNRNLIIMLVVVVGLAALYMLSSQRRPTLDQSGGFVDLVEGTLSSDEIESISIRRGDEGFKLANTDAGWVIEDHFQAPGNLNKIRTLLGNLEAVSGEIRSDDADVLGSYALADSQAYRLQVAGHLDLLIGKRSGSGCFVRKAGSNRVYVTDHNFLSDFGLWGDDRPVPEVSSWVDLLAFEVLRDDITRIRIEGEETVLLDRELIIEETAGDEAVEGDASTAPPVAAGSPGNNYEWRINEDFVGSRSRGDAILSALVSIRARDVLARDENPEGSGLDSPDRVTVTIEGGSELTMLFGGAVAEMSGQVWFRVEGEELVWAVPEFVKNNLFKSADELRAE